VKSTIKRFLVGAAGFLVVALGIVLMPLPGPGVLIVLVGVLILATQFEWAERRVDQVKGAALRGAADSVKSWPRTLMSVLGVIVLIGFGLLWGVHPDAPSWWPIDDKWWLIGGWGPGVTLILSGIVAGGVLVYSYRHFREIKSEQGAGTPLD
jgi:Na+-driven multidrug efflux pump